MSAHRFGDFRKISNADPGILKEMENDAVQELISVHIDPSIDCMRKHITSDSISVHLLKDLGFHRVVSEYNMIRKGYHGEIDTVVDKSEIPGQDSRLGTMENVTGSTKEALEREEERILAGLQHCREYYDNTDLVTGHIEADKAILSLFNNLGFVNLIGIFKKINKAYGRETVKEGSNQKEEKLNDNQGESKMAGVVFKQVEEDLKRQTRTDCDSKFTNQKLSKEIISGIGDVSYIVKTLNRKLVMLMNAKPNNSAFCSEETRVGQYKEMQAQTAAMKKELDNLKKRALMIEELRDGTIVSEDEQSDPPKENMISNLMDQLEAMEPGVVCCDNSEDICCEDIGEEESTNRPLDYLADTLIETIDEKLSSFGFDNVSLDTDTLSDLVDILIGVEKSRMEIYPEESVTKNEHEEVDTDGSDEIHENEYAMYGPRDLMERMAGIILKNHELKKEIDSLYNDERLHKLTPLDTHPPFSSVYAQVKRASSHVNDARRQLEKVSRRDGPSMVDMIYDQLEKIRI